MMGSLLIMAPVRRQRRIFIVATFGALRQRLGGVGDSSDVSGHTDLSPPILAADPNQQYPCGRNGELFRYALFRPAADRGDSDYRHCCQSGDWCVQHWEQAREWLYGSQPETLAVQIERWGRVQCARELYAVLARSGNRDEGLNRALALLDPQGLWRGTRADHG